MAGDEMLSDGLIVSTVTSGELGDDSIVSASPPS